jgi:ABC-type multidrug transport system fused ATPase/permease subunit
MPFTYTILNQDRVVFTRLKSGCGSALFIVVGSIFTVTGIGLLIFTDDPQMPLSMMRLIFPAMGIIAIVVGINFSKLQRKSTPDEIIFDNLNGRVQINQATSDLKTAFIYYDEVSDFTLKIKSERSSSSSTSTTRSSYSYHVYLSKKDGGQWELLVRNTEASAIDDIARLKSAIRLDATPVRESTNIRNSSKYIISDFGHKAELCWKNPVRVAALFIVLFSVFFISTFYTVMATAFQVEDGLPVFFMLIGAFIAVIFLIVIGGNIMRLIRNSKTVYAVVITDSSLDYFEKDNAGRIKKDVRFPLAELHAISFSFDTQDSLRKIFIYTRDQFEKKNQIENKPKFSIEYIKTLYNFYKGLIALDMQELTAVEALCVENYLQEQVRLRGRANVA